MANEFEKRQDSGIPTRLPRWRQVLSVGVTTAGLGLFLLVVAGWLGRWAWWLDIWAHFRPHLAAGLLVTAAVQLVVGRRRWAVVWGAGVILSAAPLWGLYLESPVEAGAEVGVRVGHLNLGNSAHVEAVAAWASEAKVDVLSLQEINSENLPRLEAALVGYVLVASRPRGDTRGVAAFVRTELAAQMRARIIEPTPGWDRPMVELVLPLGGGVELAVLGFHTTRPTGADVWNEQRQGMSRAAQWARKQTSAGREVLMIGDFNSTAQGSLVRTLMHEGDLRDAREGFGWRGTWPANRAALLGRLPIDGAYVSDGVAVVDLTVWGQVGSDHLPLTVEAAPASAETHGPT